MFKDKSSRRGALITQNDVVGTKVVRCRSREIRFGKPRKELGGLKTQLVSSKSVNVEHLKIEGGRV